MGPLEWPPKVWKKTGETGGQKKNRDHPYYSTVKSGIILETRGDLLSLQLLRKPQAKTSVTNLHRVKIEIITSILHENWKNLWNMKVTVIPIVIVALVTVTEGLVQKLEVLEIRGRVETIQTTVLLKSARILRRVLEPWGDLLSLKLQWETVC